MIPDDVEKIIMTKEDYDRNVEQLLLEKINAEQEIERLKGNIEILSDDLGNIGYMLGLEEGSCYEDVLEEIRKLQQKENIIKEVREYIEKDTRWFDSEYAKTYGELCTCAGANDTRLEVLVNPSNLLEILDKENI